MIQFPLRLPILAFCLIGTALVGSPVLAASRSWSLSSPDKSYTVSVSLGPEGALSYRVLRQKQLVLLDSPLGLKRDDESFERDLVFVSASREDRRREQYDLFAGPAPHIDHTLSTRSLVFENRNHASLIVDLAASDEGVAFRYRFASNSPVVHVLEAELTGFRVPLKARGWLQPYHAAGPYTPAYEDFYFHVAPGDPPPKSRAAPKGWAFPALFELPNRRGWALLTESGTDASFCGCHLRPDSADGVYRITFPEPDEATKGQTNRVGPEPRWTLPWTMPWRVIVLGRNAGDIATATLVTDLAPPSAIADASWIRPGRASWAWWSYPDGPMTARLFNEFTDLAAHMHWEYTLFDAGWWRPGLAGIAQYARTKGVRPLAWNAAADFYDAARRKQKLDQMQAAAVAGVKVDFWCSDRQEAISAMHALFAEAAERHLLVDLHGCTIPRGWQRTWPNLLTLEAVLGTESYFYEPRYTEKAAELDTVLPFTRNAIGPMDITPVACSPKKYARTTTAAHQLAAALIFTSGLVHYADKPEFFASLPSEVQQILCDAPARWDETQCLIGEPGRLAVFARRSGATWFISGINGTATRQLVRMDLSPFAKYPKRLLVSEGVDPLMQVTTAALQDAATFSHELPARGGFILRLDGPPVKR